MEITPFFIHRFITSLVFTDIIETALLWLQVRYWFRTRPPLPLFRILFAGLFASYATIPYVWFVFPNAIGWPYNTALFWSELCAFVIEALFYLTYLKLDAKKAFCVSGICNAASFALGRVLRAFGLWIYW